MTADSSRKMFLLNRDLDRPVVLSPPAEALWSMRRVRSASCGNVDDARPDGVVLPVEQTTGRVGTVGNSMGDLTTQLGTSFAAPAVRGVAVLMYQADADHGYRDVQKKTPSVHDLRTPTPIDFRLARLFAYWESKRGHRAMPARSDIDPVDLSFVLGHILLIQVTTDRRFRFRLHGSELAAHVGYDMTGQYVEDLPNLENRTVLLARCNQLLETCRPYSGMHRRTAGGRRYRYEVLWLPLSEDGVAVNMMLGGLVYTDSWASAEPVS